MLASLRYLDTFVKIFAKHWLYVDWLEEPTLLYQRLAEWAL